MRVYITQSRKILERETGIEPASNAWEAFILPLNYSRSLKSQSLQSLLPSDALLHKDRTTSNSSRLIPSERAWAVRTSRSPASTPSYIPTHRTSLLASPFFLFLKLGSPRRLRSVF